MPAPGSELDEAALEQCIDELDAAVDRLDRFPPTVIAFAMRAHLLALLSALRESGHIGESELHEFLCAVEGEPADES